MKELKITPGPWPEPVPGSVNGWATMTIEQDGLHVVVTAPHASEMDNGEWDHPEKVYEMEANAQAIAALPDLLAALVALEDAVSIDIEAGDPDAVFASAEVLNQARAAINKATGQ